MDKPSRTRGPLYRVKTTAWKDLNCAACCNPIAADTFFYAVGSRAHCSMATESWMCVHCSRTHVDRARRYWRRVESYRG